MPLSVNIFIFFFAFVHSTQSHYIANNELIGTFNLVEKMLGVKMMTMIIMMMI